MLFTMNSNNGQGFSLDTKTEAGMRRLISRLPEWQSEIEQWVQKDDDFREICQDYEDGAQFLAGLRQASSSAAPGQIAEYETLLKELEDEALCYLQE